MTLKNNFEFDLQFFGGGGGYEERQVQVRDPLPDEVKNLRTTLYDKIMPGVESFNTNAWNKAQGITDNAMTQLGDMTKMIPDSFNRSSGILDNMTSLLQTGEVPSGITDKLNAGVNKSLQSSMGSMLNGLANRGVVNSSITSQGVNNLSQAAADAYNRNYMNTFNSVLGGYGNALSGAQNNTSSLLNSVNTLGKVPSMAYEGAAAPLMPGYNLMKDLYSLYNSQPNDKETYMEEKKSSFCITGDTLVTLSDGSKIPVADLCDNDEIKAWDFDYGCLTSAPLMAFFKCELDKPLDVIRVVFEDGSNVGVIVEHLFFDIDAGKFISINPDNLDFLGHSFAKVNEEGKVIPVKVSKIFIDGKTTKTFAPQVRGHQNFLAAGFITGNDGQLEICNRFDFDINNMRYDPERKAEDMLIHTKLNYEDLKDIMSEDFFYSNHIDDWGIACSKGLISAEKIKAYLAHFAHCFIENIHKEGF